MNTNIFNAIFSTLFVIFITSCQPQPSHEVVYSQQGQPTTVVVRDNSGQEFLMNYLLWKSLMDRGGEIEVNNYYYNHRSDYEFSTTRQQQYRDEYNGYRSRKIQTQPSKGFGVAPNAEIPKDTKAGIPTLKSNGFGYSPNTSTNKGGTSVKPQPFKGFGSRPVVTKPSGGFGSTPKPTFTTPKSIQTNKSSGFGKKQ